MSTPGIVLLCLAAAILILLGIAAWRAMKLPKKTAVYQAPPADERAGRYAEKLSRMVAKESA